MKVKAIVMDMDGTITKFNLNFMDARRRVLQELDEMNLRTPDMTDQISIYVILKKLKDSLQAETFTRLRTEVYKILEDMEMKAAREVALYPGALDTLRRLRRQSLKIGIVTNNGRLGTELTFRRLKLECFFDAVVTRDDCEDMKPDAEPVRKALASMRVQPGDAILVGDGVMDILSAKAAGLPSVAVATGPFPSERLLQAEPDYLLGSINDLPNLVELLDTAS